MAGKSPTSHVGVFGLQHCVCGWASYCRPTGRRVWSQAGVHVGIDHFYDRVTVVCDCTNCVVLGGRTCGAGPGWCRSHTGRNFVGAARISHREAVCCNWYLGCGGRCCCCERANHWWSVGGHSGMAMGVSRQCAALLDCTCHWCSTTAGITRRNSTAQR